MADISKIKLPNNVTYDVESIGAAVTYTDPGTGTNLSEGYFLGVIPVALDRISITTPPTKTTYYDGDTLDLTGIVVTAIYNNGNTEVVTSSCTYSPAGGSELSTEDTSITVTYQGFTTTQSITVTVPPIYGVEWDGSSSPAMTRTDGAANFVDPVPQMSDGNGGWTTGSSPFDNIMPWSGMVRIEDNDAGTLVRIPKFYYKLNVDDTTGAFKLQISATQETGFNCSPAHMDRGDGNGERDYVYVGAYHCGTDYKSNTNNTPIGNNTRSGFRTNIHNLGSDIWQWDYATVTTIRMLYIVEFANWDSQSKIGYGCSDAGSKQNTGLTDGMTYHTGTNKTARTTYGHTRYRYIEDLWGNCLNFVDGIWFDSLQIYIIFNPADFSDSANGSSAGYAEANTSNTEIKYYKQTTTLSGLDWVLVPAENISDSSYNTYVCDLGYMHTSNKILTIGGLVTNSPNYGLFYFTGRAANVSGGSYGSRLMKLPNS